ncbi:MAG: hypothetical protein CVV10_01620 [Gammaproteobacteria bacterium HGW-Gammaproteobacteria-14]|nr:MAG: hypothetical protein CVV10_01620 [Gammaproteobacteria bacterium HGW-Gammaproteobacteria-14]
MNNYTALRMLWCSALMAICAGTTLFSNASMAEESSQGGLYHWVDEQGRRHFSDRPPEESIDTHEMELPAAQKISDPQETREINERLQRVLRANEQKREQEAQAIASEKAHRRQQLAPACRKARRDLAVLDGPFVYVQPDGTTRSVPLKQVAEDKERLQQLIKQNCN